MHWPLIGREAVLDRLVALVERGSGAAILGVAGVGKSRLLHELIDRVGASGVTAVAAVASASTRSIPFAPFVDLLPGGPTPDELAMLGAARQELDARAGGGQLLLTVDDAHQLDTASLAFLMSVVSNGNVSIVLTARTSEPMDADLVDLWTNGVIERVDVGALTESDARSLVESTLGTASDDLHSELWRLSHGNPLVLHEVLEGARDTSVEQMETGEWVQTGAIGTSPRLSDLVASRLRDLPDSLRDAMEMVSVGSPLPLSLAEGLIGNALDELETRGLVDVTVLTEERLVVPQHPLYGEILREHLSETRSRRAYRKLAEAAVAAGTAFDPLRVGLWQMESDHWLSDEIALAGARQALLRHDPVLAGRLLERLDTTDDQVAVLLGRSLSYRQHFDEAEEVLSGREPTDEASLTELASIRGQNMAFGLRDVVGARNIFAEAATKVEQPDLRARLLNEQAMVSAIRGDFDDAMTASRSVLQDPGASVVSKAAAYVTLTIALTMTGDSHGMEAILDDAISVADGAREALPFARDQIEIMRMMTEIQSGRIDVAEARCRSAIQNNRTSPAMLSTYMASLLLILAERGLSRQALAVGSQALEMYEETDPFGLEPQSLGLIAMARGQLGESVDSDFLPPPDAVSVFGPRISIWVARGAAWALAARGEIDAAVQSALSGGRQGLAGEHYVWAAMCLHDAVRFGQPKAVLSELSSIDASRGADYVASLQDHAHALCAADREQLHATASRFGRLGFRILEAEVWAELAAMQVDAGDHAAAAVACLLSKVAEAHCEDPDTPALRNRPEIISDREVQVAMDAASGLTSPEIAERRYISFRTVDNHLRSIYRKLGISGRDELSSLIG